jgi:hypothetical protein
MRNSSIARSITIRGDDLMGYGKPDYSKKWRFDLADFNGDGCVAYFAPKGWFFYSEIPRNRQSG